MNEKHVFVDWYEVDPGYGIDAPGYMPYDGSPYGVEIIAHKPKIDKTPLLKPEYPWEVRRVGFGCVFKANDEFYYYYEAINRTPQWIMLCLAKSKDGIHWEKPMLGLEEFQGSKENNIVKMGAGENLNYIDEGDYVFYEEDAPKEERFKMLFTRVSYENGKQVDVGIFAAISEDGLHWNHLGRVFSGGDSFMGVVHEKDKYYAFLKSQDSKHLVRRTIVRYESLDFKHWGNPTFILNGSLNDQPDMDYYTSPTLKWPGVKDAFIMMPTAFYRTMDHTEPLIAFSRDLNTWTIPHKNGTLISQEEMDGNGSIYANSGYMHIGNEYVHTFSSAVTGHNAYTCDPRYHTEKGCHSTYKMSFREDGYTSLHSESHGGFTTIPFNMGDGIIINAEIGIKGYIKIALTKLVENEPYDGFSFDDCKLEKIDDIHYRVTFAKDIKDLPESSRVRLRFKMFRADLYSYTLENVKEEENEQDYSYRVG